MVVTFLKVTLNSGFGTLCWPHFYQLLGRLDIGTLLFRELFLIYAIDNSGPNQTSLKVFWRVHHSIPSQGGLLVLCVWGLFEITNKEAQSGKGDITLTL